MPLCCTPAHTLAQARRVSSARSTSTLPTLKFAFKPHSSVTHLATALLSLSQNLTQTKHLILEPVFTFLFCPTNLYVHVKEPFTSHMLCNLQPNLNSWQILLVPTFPDISGFFHPLKTFCLFLKAFLKQLFIQKNTKLFLCNIPFFLAWDIDFV